MATKQGIDRGGYGAINPKPIYSSSEQEVQLTFSAATSWASNASFFVDVPIETDVVPDGPDADCVAVLDEYQWSYRITQEEFGNAYSSAIYRGSVAAGLRHPDTEWGIEAFDDLFVKSTLGYDERNIFKREGDTYTVSMWDVDVDMNTGDGTLIQAFPDTSAYLVKAAGAELNGDQRTVPLHQKIWPFSRIQFAAGVDIDGTATDLTGTDTEYNMFLKFRLTWHYESIRNWDLNRTLFENNMYHAIV